MIPLLGLLAVAFVVAALWRSRSRRHRSSWVVRELDARAAGKRMGPSVGVTELDQHDASAEPMPTCIYTAQTDPLACLVRSSGKRTG